jgi:peptide/nickel transport system permease protein
VAKVPAVELSPLGVVRDRAEPGLTRLRWLATPAGAIGAGIVTVLLIVAVFAPLVAPYDPAAQDIPHRWAGPSAQHLMGTDHLGRDLLSRVIFGSRIALSVALPAVALAVALGLLAGVPAGYLGGKVDIGLIVVIDAFQVFPALFLALALIAVYGPSFIGTVAVIAVALAPGYARVFRAMVLAVKRQQFIEAERSLGAGDLRITGRHVIPNLLAPLIVLMAMDLPGAVAIEAGLSFLGFGVRPPDPSWGVIIQSGLAHMDVAPWPVLAPSAALVLTTLGFTLLGETLRDALDPRTANVKRLLRR